MAALGNFYLDGADLESASAVYTDAALTTKAPDQWYKQGYVTREQSGGVLLPAEDCASCPEDCDQFTGAATGVAAYIADITIGTDTGAILVTLTPTASLTGIIIQLDGKPYVVGGSSTNFGWIEGCADRPVFIGDTAGDCGIGGVSWGPLVEYERKGGLWVATLNTPIVPVWPCQVQGTAGVSGTVTFVIPKTSNQKKNLRVELFGVCGGTTANFDVDCPIQLTGLDAAAGSYVDFPTACAVAYDSTMYNVPVNGSHGVPALYDIIYADPNGERTWADLHGAGFVHYEQGGVSRWVQIDSNSVVIALGNC